MLHVEIVPKFCSLTLVNLVSTTQIVVNYMRASIEVHASYIKIFKYTMFLYKNGKNSSFCVKDKKQP